ncbi:hypothetical protein O5282_00060 [Escherichia coli]|nr:hypothetical protein [Escherichia coli]
MPRLPRRLFVSMARACTSPPLEFPAVADFECTTALVEAAKSIGATTHAWRDSFFWIPSTRVRNVLRYLLWSRGSSNFRGSMEEWQAMGVMNYEMESATPADHVCKVEGLRCWRYGSGVIVNRAQQEIPNAGDDETRPKAKRGENRGVEAARRLLK